jgi:hypothetical protein
LLLDSDPPQIHKPRLRRSTARCRPRWLLVKTSKSIV